MAAGVPQQRRIPAFAPQTFRVWFKKHTPTARGRKRVILWPDTFNNYFFPETAIAATEVLESAGCEVLIPKRHLCCGRPLYDYGFLGLAKNYLKRIFFDLGAEIERGTPLVVLEPSCCTVFRDELTGLFPELPLAHKLKKQTLTLSEFLEGQDFAAPTFKKKALVHGHCHQKAIMRMKDDKSLMEKMGLEHEVLDSGCCGMAGSFGFEEDKYETSVNIGERVLLPAVRRAEPSTFLIADGFSCREQIAQLTDREALHTAQVLSIAMHNPEMDTEDYPERQIVRKREAAQKRSMQRAGVAVAALGIAALGALLTRRK